MRPLCDAGRAPLVTETQRLQELMVRVVAAAVLLALGLLR